MLWGEGEGDGAALSAASGRLSEDLSGSGWKDLTWMAAGFLGLQPKVPLAGVLGLWESRLGKTLGIRCLFWAPRPQWHFKVRYHELEKELRRLSG